MICVVVLAAGEVWESPALVDLERDRAVVVLKRCVDVDDLLASVTSGQVDVAVVALDAPGLDPTTITHLLRHGVRPVAVTSAAVDDLDVCEQAQRLGIGAVVSVHELSSLSQVVATTGDAEDTRARSAEVAPAHAVADGEGAGKGRVVVVWGPAGAPGRTTVACNLAADLASRGSPAVLVDLDPYGGAVAQQLGILDEVSGLLSASRLAGSGHLEERFASVCRGIGEHLAVVTGLPRADRWREVRGAHVERLLETSRVYGDVVVDTGFSIEEDAGSDFGGRPGRNSLTLTALDLADEVIVVGAADPVGLARLARGLVELRERSLGVPVRVVVNRMRGSIGWSEKEIAGMVEGFSRVAGLHFLPEDRAGVDGALVTGRAVVELGDSSLVRSLAGLGDAVFPASVRPTSSRWSGRRLRRSG